MFTFILRALSARINRTSEVEESDYHSDVLMFRLSFCRSPLITLTNLYNKILYDIVQNLTLLLKIILSPPLLSGFDTVLVQKCYCYVFQKRSPPRATHDRTYTKENRARRSSHLRGSVSIIPVSLKHRHTFISRCERNRNIAQRFSVAPTVGYANGDY